MRLRAWGVGMKLQSEGTLSMSPVRLFQQRTGAYLLGLQVQYESGAQDQHCAAYLSDFEITHKTHGRLTGVLIDNLRRNRPLVMEDKDRTDQAAAVRVLRQFYSGMTSETITAVRLTQVYRMQPI